MECTDSGHTFLIQNSMTWHLPSSRMI